MYRIKYENKPRSQNQSSSVDSPEGNVELHHNDKNLKKENYFFRLQPIIYPAVGDH